MQYDFYHYDIRGSVTNIVKWDINRVKAVQEYEYDVFGKTEQVKGESATKNEVKFTGALHENNSGLYYMNARHYDPNTGRFLQQDVYKGDERSPWTQNRYTYCGNNPVNMIDPSGHFFISISAGTIAVLKLMGIVGGVSATYSAVNQAITNKKINPWKVGTSFIRGATSVAPSILAKYAGAGITAAIDEGIDAHNDNREYNVLNPIGKVAIFGAFDSVFGGLGDKVFGTKPIEWDAVGKHIYNANSSVMSGAAEMITEVITNKADVKKKNSNNINATKPPKRKTSSPLFNISGQKPKTPVEKAKYALKKTANILSSIFKVLTMTPYDRAKSLFGF